MRLRPVSKEKVYENLLEVRELLEKPECWVKKVGARDIEGNIVKGFNPNAVAWCIVGAIENVVGYVPNYFTPEYKAIDRELPRSFLSGSLIAFNDYPAVTHKDVLDLLDKTIKVNRPFSEKVKSFISKFYPLGTPH